MNTYGITFIDDGDTISVEVDFYEIRDGFVTLYLDKEMGRGPVQVASYSADNIRQIVEQKVFTEEEVLAQINE